MTFSPTAQVPSCGDQNALSPNTNATFELIAVRAPPQHGL